MTEHLPGPHPAHEEPIVEGLLRQRHRIHEAVEREERTHDPVERQEVQEEPSELPRRW